jgi:two-component system chemotaxis response regulator CheY
MKIILVADDSPIIRKVAKRLLTDMGFVVTEAENADQVLAACRENMPDALMLDWEMQGTNTVELIPTILRLPHGADCKILFCTSETMVLEMTRAKRAGAAGFLLKPFNRKILAAKLAETGIIAVAETAA